jgi:RHS repeat-associated protein
VFIEERNNKWNTPYLFNAKELDEETGLYYYGARYYDGRTATWLGVDPMWEKYPGVSAFAYCTNNPVKYIDPDGRKIKLADNYTGAMTNIAQIAATNLGNEALNHIINCKETYTLNSTFLTSNSTYNAITRTIFYVGNPWSSDIEGGFLNSMTAMGHEIFHAFDHSYNVFNTRNAGYSINIAEPRAVSFANYLRQAYSLYPLREKHGTTKGNFHQFQNLDKVSNFTLLGNNADNTSFGFSYTKTTTTVIDYIEVVGYRIPNKKIVNSQVHYIIVSTDKDKNVTYQIYNNENEYKNASQGWQ